MIKTLKFANLQDRKPTHYESEGLDLVYVRYDDRVSVLYGRCQHRGALMADGYIEGDNLIAVYMDGIIAMTRAFRNTTIRWTAPS